MNAPRLFVEIKAGERPPEEMEKMFVENMESMAIRQSDVTQVASVIRSGSARITVTYVQHKDMDEAFLDLQKAILRLASYIQIDQDHLLQIGSGCQLLIA